MRRRCGDRRGDREIAFIARSLLDRAAPARRRAAVAVAEGRTERSQFAVDLDRGEGVRTLLERPHRVEQPRLLATGVPVAIGLGAFGVAIGGDCGVAVRRGRVVRRLARVARGHRARIDARPVAPRLAARVGKERLEKRREDRSERRVEIGVAALGGFAEPCRIALGEARKQEPRVVDAAAVGRIDVVAVDPRNRSIELATRGREPKPREPRDRRGLRCREQRDGETPDLSPGRDRGLVGEQFARLALDREQLVPRRRIDRHARRRIEIERGLRRIGGEKRRGEQDRRDDADPSCELLGAAGHEGASIGASPA